MDDLPDGGVDHGPLLPVRRQVDLERAPLGLLPVAIERLRIVELDLAHAGFTAGMIAYRSAAAAGTRPR